MGDHGLIFGADCSRLAPALYDADRQVILPEIGNDGYVDVLLSFCRDNGIKAVLSLLDPELNVVAEHRQDFLAVGTTPIVSDFGIVDRCFNKYDMFRFLSEQGIRTPKSYVDRAAFQTDHDAGLIDFPVFVKPIRGSASMNIGKASNMAEFDFLFGRQDGMMVQEYLDGSEYGADVYIDLISSEVVGIFTKQKLKMRAGETDKAVSMKDGRLFELIRTLAVKTGVRGIIDVDIFKVGGEYYIGEINPRIGGGCPMAIECGMNVPRMIINNLNGVVNPVEIGNYEENVYMMKYNEVMIKRNL